MMQIYKHIFYLTFGEGRLIIWLLFRNISIDKDPIYQLPSLKSNLFYILMLFLHNMDKKE